MEQYFVSLITLSSMFQVGSAQQLSSFIWPAIRKTKSSSSEFLNDTVLNVDDFDSHNNPIRPGFIYEG